MGKVIKVQFKTKEQRQREAAIKSIKERVKKLNW